MRFYKIETKNENNGSWSTVMTFKPEYRMTVARKGWLFPKEYGVIDNLREAELHSLEKAHHFAHALHHVAGCRIMQESDVDGNKTVDLLWQNGHHVDGSHHGVLSWLWGLISGQH